MRPAFRRLPSTTPLIAALLVACQPGGEQAEAQPGPTAAAGAVPGDRRTAERPAGRRTPDRMPKLITYDEEARGALKRGIDALADAVGTTLGPKGRNVGLDKKFGAPTVTHDGVTVARDIELADPFENMGAQLLKEAATKTEDVAAKAASDAVKKPGADGTSTNALEVRVGADKIEYLVNGTSVHTTPKTGQTAKTDGIAGIRVNHQLEVHIDDFSVMAFKPK